MFGEGFKHVDSSECLQDGNYTVKIVKAEQKAGNYGDYIQVEVEVEGHPNCNPRMFLINDSPKAGFGSYTKEQALEMWNRTMTKFFESFAIPEGNFTTSAWLGHKGTVTVRPQKKNPQYKEIVPGVVQAKKQKAEATAEEPAVVVTAEKGSSSFPEDIPF